MLNDSEETKDTKRCECLAVVWAILLLTPFLQGQGIAVCTDHDGLNWILKLAMLTGRLPRWRLRLSEFDFGIVSREGIQKWTEDALSLLETEGTDETLLKNDISKLVVSLVEQLEPHQEELDCSLAEKYCVCDSRNVLIGKTQNAWTEGAAIVRENATHIATEEGPTLKSSLREEAADPKCQAAAHLLDILLHETSKTAMESS